MSRTRAVPPCTCTRGTKSDSKQVIELKALAQRLAQGAAGQQQPAGLHKAARAHRPAAQAPHLVAQRAAQHQHQRGVLALRDARQRRIEQRRRNACTPQQGRHIVPPAPRALHDLRNLQDGNGVLGGGRGHGGSLTLAVVLGGLQGAG
jgi:hypothetical protein